MSIRRSALEPVISAEIMELHHSKHHQAYVTWLQHRLRKIPRGAPYSPVDRHKPCCAHVPTSRRISCITGRAVNQSETFDVHVSAMQHLVCMMLQAEAKQDVATMISLQPALKFNGGGDFPHFSA